MNPSSRCCKVLPALDFLQLPTCRPPRSSSNFNTDRRLLKTFFTLPPMDPKESRCTYGPLKGELWRDIYQFELWRNYPEIYSPDSRYALRLGPAANTQAAASTAASLGSVSFTTQPGTLPTAPATVSAYDSAAGSSNVLVAPPATVSTAFSSAADAAALPPARATHTLAPMSSIAPVAFSSPAHTYFAMATEAGSPLDAPSASFVASLAASMPAPTSAVSTSSSITSSSSSRSDSPPKVPAPASFADALLGAWSTPGASSSRARAAPSPEPETDEREESSLFFPDIYYDSDSSFIESRNHDFILPEEESEEEDEAAAIAKARAGKAPARSLAPSPLPGPIYQAPEGLNSALVQNMVQPPRAPPACSISPWVMPDNVAPSGYREATEQERMAAYRNRYPDINNSPYMPAEVPRNLGSRIDRVAEMRAAQSRQREAGRRKRAREEREATKVAKGKMRAKVVDQEEEEEDEDKEDGEEDGDGDEAMGEDDDEDDDYYASAPAWFKGSMKV